MLFLESFQINQLVISCEKIMVRCTCQQSKSMKIKLAFTRADSTSQSECALNAMKRESIWSHFLKHFLWFVIILENRYGQKSSGFVLSKTLMQYNPLLRKKLTLNACFWISKQLMLGLDRSKVRKFSQFCITYFFARKFSTQRSTVE